MTNKRVYFSCLALILCGLSAPAFSQSEEKAEQTSEDVETLENAEANTSDEDDQDIEVISVTGQSTNPAMKAFHAGDFELAAVEFRKNARCALRQERAKQSFVESLQNSSINQIVQGGSVDAAGISNTATTTGTGGSASNRESVLDSTCGNRGFQLYMAGLSQIQLGQIEEAEKNFRRATVENKRLYDAHYRLALIFLLQGDLKAAEKSFSSLKSLQEKCKECDAKDEILARVEHVKQALAGKVKMQ